VSHCSKGPSKLTRSWAVFVAVLMVAMIRKGGSAAGILTMVCSRRTWNNQMLLTIVTGPDVDTQGAAAFLSPSWRRPLLVVGIDLGVSIAAKSPMAEMLRPMFFGCLAATRRLVTRQA
jgi:hypothetical protein